MLVKDILRGAGDGLLNSKLVAIGGTVYFAAGDGVNGRELWRSGGTALGTFPVKDIYAGFGNFGSGNPDGVSNVNGTLFFRAQSSFADGQQPWIATAPKRVRSRSPSPLSYTIPIRQHVRLRLFDVNGREVRTLLDGQQSAGTHRITMTGRGLSSGTYFYQLETDTGVRQRKLIVL